MPRKLPEFTGLAIHTSTGAPSTLLKAMRVLAAAAEPINTLNLCRSARIKYKTLHPYTQMAVGAGLLTTKRQSRDGIMHTITPAGVAWLQKADGLVHLEADPTRRALPRTFCHMEQNYVPDNTVFVRNSGLKHIKSKGF